MIRASFTLAKLNIIFSYHYILIKLREKGGFYLDKGKKAFSSIFKITASFFLLLLFSWSTVNVNAKELNQTGFVDEFTITPTSYWFNDIGSLKIDISEKPDNKLKNGDTLTIEAPENMTLAKFTSDEPLELSEGGIVYGYGVTNSDLTEITFTFNENVDENYNFKGQLNLSVKAGHVMPEGPGIITTVDYETNLGTNLEKKPYEIKNSMTIGNYPYFYKPNGQVYSESPNKVSWEFHINRSKDPLATETKVIDTLQPGQVLPRIDSSQETFENNVLKSDFWIEIETADDLTIKTTLSVDEYIDLGYGEVKFINETEFEFIAYQQTLREYSVSVKYYSNITPEGKYQKYFYNDVIAEHIDPATGETKSYPDSGRAVNLQNNAIIAPEKGVLRIIKLAKDETKSKPLANVTFKLYKKDGTLVDFVDNKILKTDASGKVDTPLLEPGDYYVTEVDAPDFVVFDKDKQYPFTISADADEGVILAIGNDLKTIDIPVEKKWMDNKEEYPKIKFNLLADGTIIDSVELESGTLNHIFKELPISNLSGQKINYTIEEEAIDGYESVVEGNPEDGFVVTNTPITLQGEFIAKKEASKKVLIPDEVFEYKITVENTVKDSVLKNLLVEDTMPEGIEIVGNLRLDGQSTIGISGDSFKVTIPELKGGESAEILIDVKVKTNALEGEVINIAKVTDPEDPDNPKEPDEKVEVIRELDLRLLKTSMDGKSVLKDAKFEVYQIIGDEENLLHTAISNNDGRIDFKKLKSGTYLIKEVSAPDGFKLLEKPIKITIDKRGVLELADSLSDMVSFKKVGNIFELTVKNEEEPSGGILPQTGGVGNSIYTTISSVFMLVTLSLLGYYVYRNRKGWQ